MSSLQDEDLHRVIRYTTTNGAVFENPLWQILFHVVNHGTPFRSEAAVILTSYGCSPGDLDYIAFGRTQRQSEEPS